MKTAVSLARKNKAPVTPLHIDMTHHAFRAELASKLKVADEA